MDDRDTSRAWETISELLVRAHGQYDSENISQLEHALQSADLAQRANASRAEITAALLHDVGHLIAPVGPVGAEDHDRVGACFLEELGFGPSVVSLVRGHVDAKRYLVWRDSGYQSHLSEASQISLELQGGAMTSAEARAFSQDGGFRARIRLRSWDDRAKVEHLVVPVLDEYRPLVLSQLRASA